MDNAVMQSNESSSMEAAPTAQARKTTPKGQHPDRIRINADAVKRLAVWSEQMDERLRGIKLTRSDLVNFLILNHADTLSALEMRDLHSRYFDEVKLIQWALTELVSAKARGEDITFDDIMTQYRPSETVTPRTRKQKSNVHKNEEKTLKTASKQSNTTSKESPISVDYSAGK